MQHQKKRAPSSRSALQPWQSTWPLFLRGGGTLGASGAPTGLVSEGWPDVVLCKPELKFQLCYSATVELWVSPFTFLSLSFLMYEMRKHTTICR